MTPTNFPLTAENLAEIRSNPELFEQFIESQRSEGVTVKAIAKKLLMSRQAIYERLKQKEKAASDQTASPSAPDGKDA